MKQSAKTLVEPLAGISIMDQTSKKTFELVHQRLKHAGVYRLKDVHLHVSGVEAFNVPMNFKYKVCDPSKIIRTQFQRGMTPWSSQRSMGGDSEDWRI